MSTQDKIFAACEPVDGLYRHPETGLFVRHRSDAWLLMTMKRDYGRLTAYPYAGTTVLDLGGMIGTFAWYAIERLGAARVVSVEPLPEHVSVFKKNHDKDPRVDLIVGAVTSTGLDRVELYLDPIHSTGTSLFAGRTRAGSISVASVDLRELLLRYEPALVKCDVEGTEYALDWDDLPDSVTEVCMELHQRSAHGWVAGTARIDDTLAGQGFRAVVRPRRERVYGGMQMGLWSRR